MFKSILPLFLSLLFFNCANSQNHNKAQTELNTGIQSTEKLSSYTFFQNMTISLPSSLKRLGKISTENSFGMASLESENKLVNVTVRKKSTTDLERVKKMHESMATSMYKGEVHKSKFLTINGKNVYVFEQTGYWNDSEVPEAWVKFYTNFNNNLYQCLVRFPANERLSTTGVINEIVNSLVLIK